MNSSVLYWYDQHAPVLGKSYEAAPAVSGQHWLADLLPQVPAIIMDVGAGTGRDARAFAAAGYDVIAVEPSSGMRTEAAAWPSSPRIRWVSDSLPALLTTARLGIAADVVLLNASWQHVAPGDRSRAFRKLVGLLRSGALLVLTLRHGGGDGRGDYPISVAEVIALGRDHGMQVLREGDAADPLKRSDVTWTNLVLRLPDDGTGALPLLRHLILTDAKSATYKLGLLRSLCRAADGSAGMADYSEDHVVLPLGLVALIWLQLYWPLVDADLPQTPGNKRGGEGLGFAGPGWQALTTGAVSRRDLRVGAIFAGSAAQTVHTALREAVDHVRRMPASFLTFPNGGRILETIHYRTSKPDRSLILDRERLASFGLMRVPRHVWSAMQRFAAWIEPALVSEWRRLIENYAAAQGRVADTGKIAAAMTWLDSARDVALPRARALRLLEQGQALHCVWSGKRLYSETLDVDHCLPWVAWPCGDLWNLVPADRRVNQQGKRDRLPSASALDAAASAIANWWSAAYLRSHDSALPARFVLEARASLPGLQTQEECGPEQVQAAMALQRMRLHRDQGVPEWNFVDRLRVTAQRP